MAIEPIYEKVVLNGKRKLAGESMKIECKTGVATESVSEVLSVSARASSINAQTTDGQIKCDCKAIFYICYLGTDGEIKKTEGAVDFSGVLVGECVRAGFKPTIKLSVGKTDFDLSGAYLTAVAQIALSADLSETTEIDSLSGGEGLVIDLKEIPVTKSYGVRDSIYPLEEEFELSYEIKEVLSHKAYAVITAVQCGVGSIIVDGQVFLSVIVLQKSEKCSIIKEMRAIPFRMEIEHEDAMPTMQAVASVCEKSLKTDVLVDEQSGKSTVSVSMNLAFIGEAFVADTRSIAGDAFCVKENLELVTEGCVYYKPCELRTASFNVNGRAGTSELPIGVTLFATDFDRVEILSTERQGSAIKVTGVITAIGYFSSEQDKAFTRKLELPFEKEIECALDFEQIELSVEIKPEKCSARLVSATEIEVDLDMNLTVYPQEKLGFSCIKEIKSVGEKTENPHAISVYIPLENEELWSLSKRLNVCPTDLVETNPDLTFPLTGEERIVVFRQK